MPGNIAPEFLYAFGGALMLSLALTPFIRKISLKLNRVEKVKDDRWHKEPVPVLGGIAIWISWLAISLYLLKSEKLALILIACASMIFVFGLLDDLYHFNPITKLIYQIVIASIVIKMGIIIKIIPNPIIGIPLTIFWIIIITNAFNLLDNMDGLSTGIAAISSISLFLMSLQSGDILVSILSLSLAGASIGFLKYNFYPAKIFMGDCGSMFLGFTLSIIAIIGTWRHASNLLITMIVPLLVLGVPLFDTFFVSVTRKLRGVPISLGGIDHISHRLVSLGMSQKRAVLTLYAFSAFMGGIAVYYNMLNPIIISLGVALIIVSLFCLGLFLGEMDAHSKENPGDSRYAETITKPGYNFISISKRRIAEMMIDLVLINVSLFSAYMLRFEGNIPNDIYKNMVGMLPWLIIIKLGILSVSGIYQSVWRYIGARDVVNIVTALTISSIIIYLIVFYQFLFIDFSRSAFIIDWMICIILFCGFRFSFKMLREYIVGVRLHRKNILIIGAGDTGALLAKEIQSNSEMNYRVAGFIDDNPVMKSMKINGVSVLGNIDSISSILENETIEEAFIAIPLVRDEIIAKISNACKQKGIKYKTFPMIRDIL